MSLKSFYALFERRPPLYFCHAAHSVGPVSIQWAYPRWRVLAETDSSSLIQWHFMVL